MKKQLFSLLTALTLAGAAVPADTVSAEEPESIGFTYEINGGSLTITGYTGSDAVLIIPEELEGSPVTAIGKNVFSGMSELTAVVIPDTVVSIGERSFSACPQLCTVSLGRSVSSIGGYAFSACPKLTSFSVSSGNSTYASSNGSLTSEKGRRLVIYAGGNEAAIPDGVNVVTKGSFMGKTNITSVTIPDTVTSLGDYTFSGCTSLKSASIPDSVTNVGEGCFMSCSSLGEVELGSGISEIRVNTFNSCTSLEQIIIPDTVTAISSHAFFDCAGLSGIYIPETITSIGENSLGMHYDLRSGSIDTISGFVLHGYKDSAAGEYAAAYGIEIRPFLMGDLDDNGTVDGSDATLVLKEYSYCMDHTGSTLDVHGRLAGDYDKNGAVDGSDATLILREYGRQLAAM